MTTGIICCCKQENILHRDSVLGLGNMTGGPSSGAQSGEQRMCKAPNLLRTATRQNIGGGKEGK